MLHLAFHDAEPVRNIQLPGNVVLMNEGQAREIWQFVDRRRIAHDAFLTIARQRFGSWFTSSSSRRAQAAGRRLPCSQA